jgi:hypothetical protein
LVGTVGSRIQATEFSLVHQSMHAFLLFSEDWLPAMSPWSSHGLDSLVSPPLSPVSSLDPGARDNASGALVDKSPKARGR